MIEDLLRSPQLFSFFQAVHLAEIESGRDIIGHLGPVIAEPVRFRGQFGLGFPPAEIASTTMLSRGQNEENAQPIEIEATLLGLYGSVSPLPSDLTEMIIQQDDTGTMRDFLDIFNHRLISLLYRIWRHGRVDANRRELLADPFSFALRCLAGLGNNDVTDSIDKGSLLHSVRHLVGWTRSAVDLAAVLNAQFGEGDWTVEEFVSREVSIPPEFQWCLGRAEPYALGEELVLGDRMPDVTGRIHLHVQAKDWESYRALLLDGSRFREVRQVVQRLLRDPLDVIVIPSIDPAEIRSARLDGQDDSALGLCAWLDMPNLLPDQWPGFVLDINQHEIETR